MLGKKVHLEETAENTGVLFTPLVCLSFKVSRGTRRSTGPQFEFGRYENRLEETRVTRK